MLKIIVPEMEWYDESREEFLSTKEQTLILEHSLLSISKWESKHHKSFLDSIESLTNEELLDYVRCMTINKGVDPIIYQALSRENIRLINDYMSDPMSGTHFYKDDEKGNKSTIRDKVTSELIYYWMISLNIPVEFEKWHINRLLTLIEVFNVKQNKDKPMSADEIRRRNAKLNAARRKQLKSRG